VKSLGGQDLHLKGTSPHVFYLPSRKAPTVIGIYGCLISMPPTIFNTFLSQLLVSVPLKFPPLAPNSSDNPKDRLGWKSLPNHSFSPTAGKLATLNSSRCGCIPQDSSTCCTLLAIRTRPRYIGADIVNTFVLITKQVTISLRKYYRHHLED
jgi:hypothetical protein